MNQRTRNIFIFFGIALLVFLLVYFRNIVTYILIAAVLSLVGRPIINLLRRIPFGNRRMGSSLGAILSLLILWGGLFGFFSFLIPLLAAELSSLSDISVSAIVDYLYQAMEQVSINFPMLLPDGIEHGDLESFMQEELLGLLKVSQVSDVFGSVAGTIGNFFLMFFSVSFILFFFLKEETMLANGILVFVPNNYEEQVRHSMNSIHHLLKRYFVGIILEVFGVMLIDAIGFTIIGLGFSHAVVVAVFAGIMNVIPYIGPWIGGIFGVVVAIATNLENSFTEVTLPLMLLVILIIIIAQVLDNILFQPIIYSSSVNAHPLEIFLVILMAASLAGIPGMILAIPVYTVLRVIAREFLFEFKFVRKLTEGIDS